METSPVLAGLRVAAYAAWTVLLLPFQAVAVGLRLRAAEHIPVLYHRGCCRISVLGGLIRGSFIAKREVADWPLFGLCAKLQRSVFIDRRPSNVDDQKDQIAERLRAGDNLILFPEGTSGDGNRVLPFKSALFVAAERRIDGRAVTVQPESVAYTKHSNLPMGRALRPYYAWYGDMALVAHMWRVLGLGPATVVVHFHAPVTIDGFAGRKELATHCRRAVSMGLAAALHGGPTAAPTAPAAAPAPA
jgi:1-acyl-sn-glycerol-3-phosphate acyltransferase